MNQLYKMILAAGFITDPVTGRSVVYVFQGSSASSRWFDSEEEAKSELLALQRFCDQRVPDHVTQ